VSDSFAKYSDGVPAEYVLRFRKQADSCHQQAEQATNLLDKVAWLQLADDWARMATGR
jgi:hypothetical protein